MIANSPVPQDLSIGTHGIDVHLYQPPWQTLSDFATNMNLKTEPLDPDNPDFRRLVHQVIKQ